MIGLFLAVLLLVVVIIGLMLYFFFIRRRGYWREQIPGSSRGDLLERLNRLAPKVPSRTSFRESSLPRVVGARR